MRSLITGALFILCIGISSAQTPKSSSSEQWKPLEQALGRSGSEQPGAVYKFSLPRTDLHVRIGDVNIKPALALVGWLAFKGTASNALVLGDLVLADDEVAAVTERLQAVGIQQTAIHNHLLHENPRVVYMHVMAHGDAAKLGAELKQALAATKLPPPAPASQTPLTDLDQQKIEQALGLKGKVNGGVLQFSAPRKEKVMEHDEEVPPAMGTATAMNFQPTGGGKAAITGDFVLTGNEVNPVIQVLRSNGIEVTALHSHMIEESPRLFFMHFWANDDAVKLGRALRAALEKTESRMATALSDRSVVFVSEYGAALSVISAAYFNKLAQEEHLDLRAVARGIAPQENLSVAVQRGLTRDGMTIESKVPERLSTADAQSAPRIVAFYPVPEEYSRLSPTQMWDDVTWYTSGTHGPDYEGARDRVLSHR